MAGNTVLCIHIREPKGCVVDEFKESTTRQETAHQRAILAPPPTHIHLRHFHQLLCHQSGYSVSQKMYRQGFLAIVPRRLRIKKYIHPLSVYINAILQNFIELSLTMTKLFHIKRDHLVTFYISLEKKREYCDISATV